MLKTKSHYILIAVLSAILFIFFSAYLRDPCPLFDVWYHLAALRELIYHPGGKVHPLFLIDTSHRDYAPYYFIFSRLSVIWGRDVFLTFKIVGLLNFILYSFFLTGFLGRAFGCNSKTKGLALLGTLFLWGSPWLWSAVYSFKTLTFTAGYPSFSGFVISIGSLYYLYGYLYQDRLKDLFLSLILFYIFFVTYPPVVLFYFINVALVIPRNRKKIFLLILLFSLAILMSFLWPLFSFGSITSEMLNTVGGKTHDHIPSYKNIVRRLWPSILGIYAVFSLKDNNGLSRFCRRGFLLSFSLFIATLKFNHNLWCRFLLFSVFYLQIGFSVYIATLTFSVSKFFKKLTSTNLIIQKVFCIFFFIICCYQMVYVRRRICWLKIPLESYKRVGSILGDRDVVLSDVVTGAPLSAFGPKIISPIQIMFGVEDQIQRRYDVYFFLSSPEKTKQCYEVLSKYKSEYLLINKKIPNFERFNRFGEIIYSDDYLILIHVAYDLHSHFLRGLSGNPLERSLRKAS
jgi:hypothetical protein